MFCMWRSSQKVIEPQQAKPVQYTDTQVKPSWKEINLRHEEFRRASILPNPNVQLIKIKSVLAFSKIAKSKRAEKNKEDDSISESGEEKDKNDTQEESNQQPRSSKSFSMAHVASRISKNRARRVSFREEGEVIGDEKVQRKPSIFHRLVQKATQSVLSKKQDPGAKVKSDVERLWKIRCSLYKKESFRDEEISLLRSLISETLDLTGRLRIMVRESEDHTDQDVDNYCKDINGLQLLFYNIVEIWQKVADPERKKYKDDILMDIMELSSDVASITGEILLVFLQRFQLNIIPLLKPIHGLFYALGLHVKYNCLDKDLICSHSAPGTYSGFLAGILQLFRSAKILLKRLKFEDDASKGKKKLVQTNIASFVSEATVSHGLHSLSTDELREMVLRIGNICTDAFYTIGKTSGTLDYIDLGDGVHAVAPLESLGLISHCDFIQCPIESRSALMAGIQLHDGQHYVSDFFQVTGSAFRCQEKITLCSPIHHSSFPASATVRVKTKTGDKWTDVEGDIMAGKCEFKASYMEAFVVVAGYRPYHREITPAGFTYMSDDDSRIRINFPPNCFSRPCIVQFRLIQLNRNRIFSYKETCPDMCKYVTCISDVLFIKHDDDVIINEPALVHMPIINDMDDYETEIVVFRKRADGEVEVIPRPMAMRCESTGNCYTFQIDRFCGLAVGKANKRQMKKNRRAIIDEFNLYYETEHICTILTLMDRSSLQSGVVKLWTEVVEKRFLKRIMRMRMKEGLFEIPGSRSPDIRMKDYDVVRIDLEGNIGKIRDLSYDHYFISYLSSSNQNHRSFPIEPRRDPRGRQIGIINYYRESGQEDVCIHLVSMETERFLVSGPRLPTSHSDAKPSSQMGRVTWSRGSQKSSKSVRSTIVYRSMFDEVPVLSHQSLLVLAGALPHQYATSLGVALRLPYEDILDIKALDQPPIITNFEILWKWRGKVASVEMVDALANAFREIKQKKFIDVIMKANCEKRPLKHGDFAARHHNCVQFAIAPS
ncbi:uncharacterized protein LOC134261360 [Saccostrea cucullata]|uniref:uncharacterized protein LOC134261360 n=1 Tax=Saccostrea cuccullata TaxID=36930 RepID=UPI002ED4190B